MTVSTSSFLARALVQRMGGRLGTQQSRTLMVTLCSSLQAHISVSVSLSPPGPAMMDWQLSNREPKEPPPPPPVSSKCQILPHHQRRWPREKSSTPKGFFTEFVYTCLGLSPLLHEYNSSMEAGRSWLHFCCSAGTLRMVARG